MYEELQKWVNENVPDDKLIWKRGLGDQVMFVRDKIPAILARSSEEYRGIKERIMVVSTHHSKSVCLPVYRLEWFDYTFTMRYNFYNWIVSVRTPYGKPFYNIDWLGMITSEDKDINSVYCEGFSKDDVYGAYKDGERKFTISLYDNYELYTFFKVIKNWVVKEEAKRVQNQANLSCDDGSQTEQTSGSVPELSRAQC